jgi:hypothetical protein
MKSQNVTSCYLQELTQIISLITIKKIVNEKIHV